MGFTRTHVVGVFVTEALCCAIGLVLAVCAFFAERNYTTPLLLAAICSILSAIAVLLASILSLVFFVGWPSVQSTDTSKQDNV